MKFKPFFISLLFIIVFFIYLFIDYLNIMSFFVENVNIDYLAIFVQGIIPIYLFFITYYLVDKRISDNENEKKKNKEFYLNVILFDTYRGCKLALDNYDENVSMAKKIDKKNPNVSVLDYLKFEESYIFRNDSEIINLLNDGVADSDIITQYLFIKEQFHIVYRCKWLVDEFCNSSSQDDEVVVKEVKNITNKRVTDLKEILQNEIDDLKSIIGY